VKLSIPLGLTLGALALIVAAVLLVLVMVVVVNFVVVPLVQLCAILAVFLQFSASSIKRQVRPRFVQRDGNIINFTGDINGCLFERKGEHWDVDLSRSRRVRPPFIKMLDKYARCIVWIRRKFHLVDRTVDLRVLRREITEELAEFFLDLRLTAAVLQPVSADAFRQATAY